jgi:uncharacterized membrane protein YuzA (DUF378 family)
MFCPRCATENKNEQRYCRQCGLTLSTIRLALEGQVDAAIQKYKKCENTLDWGFIILLIGGLNAGINAFFRAWPVVIFSGVIGFLVGITLILIGLSRMGHATKMLNPPEKKVEPETNALNQPEHANSALAPAPITEELRRTPARPPSVIENTTLELKRRE